MEYDEIYKVMMLEEGDVIELEGKKYYIEFYDGRPCGVCSLRDNLCSKYFGLHGKYDCACNSVYAISAEEKIKEEQEKIKKSEDLIKKLS